ncbi:hypothetical protein HanXRQr2_Chr10g0430351 [Helianthus annuus]|uniref:Uncharacterized protein n=1 Tax=Helianthus annuus TaxID=4232 RepID=A0A9K3N3C7_HELAN|nr:hypothetical protein HanXRQr2_Chr10g0430351 [Helianthus annuus]KAJ0513125.1 hypothetical protein HanHA300_Chr10g0353881 [Helianthus annuus]KAJ0529247.1 hypothetical protein HanHA89_Chr10g0375561 [Helianthus annuus]KAJ0696129.1 hypothetical protein HanLR1_Chr10g0353411 [Helianthus annuus]
MGPCPRSSRKDKPVEASIAHHGAVLSEHGGMAKVLQAHNCNCELQLMKRDSVRRARGRAQRTRGRAQASVQPINRSAWIHCNSSLGTPPLSYFIHHPPPTTITTPSSTTIIHCLS